MVAEQEFRVPSFDSGFSTGTPIMPWEYRKAACAQLVAADGAPVSSAAKGRLAGSTLVPRRFLGPCDLTARLYFCNYSPQGPA